MSSNVDLNFHFILIGISLNFVMQCVALAGIVWNRPTSCAWAARVYVNNRYIISPAMHPDATDFSSSFKIRFASLSAEKLEIMASSMWASPPDSVPSQMSVEEAAGLQVGGMSRPQANSILVGIHSALLGYKWQRDWSPQVFSYAAP